jgi:molybdenum cofactor synthesis domain-containing protein
MEALVGLNVCLLTIYDLAKAVDPVIEISDIFLQTKEGGKSGIWKHPKHQSQKTVQESPDLSFQNLRFAVGTLSDRASQGVYQDESGTLLRNYCNERSGTEDFYKVIPDDKESLRSLVNDAVEHHVDVLLLTGGTGISKRDITPDVIEELSSKELKGFGEFQRQFGSQFTKASWLSRSSAYVVKDTLVVLFPGSPKAVQQGLDCIGSLVPHAVRMLRGESHHEEARGVNK